jgi:DNA polymerase I-like protein with 3'-5' exonuclease and polymerase domains
VYSSGKDCLDMLSLRKEFPDDVKSVCKLLLEFAKLDKDVGTYYLREDMDEEGNVIKQSGMLQYLTPENIVHHILNCTSTVTGRLSSNRPNMQNIPRGDTSDVKRIFTSRFGADGYIIEADYSALEVVALAAFSKDTALVKALMDGTDMHCMRLSQQLNEPYEDVLKKCKDETHPQHKEYKTMRTHIKPKAFAYQYGATAQGIAFATGCTVEEAQEFIDAEKALFPEVETYYDEVITKYVEEHTSMHREQTENGAWRVYRKGVWQAPGGTCYEFREHSKVKWVDGQRHEVMEFKPTQIRNYPIQGESGFFVQGIAGQVVRWLLGKDFFNGKCYIINQVHDALYLDCHKDVIHEVCSTVKFIMESLPEFFKQYGYDLGVTFPAEVEFGPNMLEKEKFHE